MKTPPVLSPIPTSARNQEASTVPLALVSVGELFGGVERHILGLLKGLHERDIPTPLFVFQDGELASQARQAGAQVVVLAGSHIALPATVQQLANHLRDGRVRVVHVHGYKATAYASAARWLYPFSMVKTEHGMPEVIAGHGMQLRARLYDWIDTIATRSSAAAVCYVTDDLRAQRPLLPSRIRTRVIANGVDAITRAKLTRPADFDPTWYNVPIIGRLEPVKGHAHAIDALAAAAMPPNVHLHIIGTGPLEDELRQHAQERGVAARVHFQGFRRNVFDYLAHGDTLLIPSLHEGLPYTLLEAMALATPIICSNVGGLAEVLKHDETALLIPAADPVAITAAIRQLHGDRNARQRLGTAALHVQQERYSLQAMVDAYIDVYQGVLAPPSHR